MVTAVPLPEPTPRPMEAPPAPAAHEPTTVEEDVDVSAWI